MPYGQEAGLEAKRIKFLSDEPYNLRFLSFMISVPSVLSAVTPSVAAKPSWVIRG
jgi:hypothetical protein